MGAVLPLSNCNDQQEEMGKVCPFVIPEASDKKGELTKEELMKRFANLETLIILADGSENMKTFLVSLNNIYSREEIAGLYKSLLDKNIIGYQIELLIYNRYRMDTKWFFEEVTSTDGDIVDAIITWINNMSVVYELENKAVKGGALNLKSSENRPIRFSFTDEEREKGKVLCRQWDRKYARQDAAVEEKCRDYTKRLDL